MEWMDPLVSLFLIFLQVQEMKEKTNKVHCNEALSEVNVQITQSSGLLGKSCFPRTVSKEIQRL